MFWCAKLEWKIRLSVFHMLACYAVCSFSQRHVAISDEACFLLAPTFARPSVMASRWRAEPAGFFPQFYLAPNPHHAPADSETLLANLREMQDHAHWCQIHSEKWMAAQQSPVAPRPDEHRSLAATVARLMSVGLKGESGNKFRELAKAISPHNPQVSAEMMWIIMACDAEDEQSLFSFLANLAREKLAINLDEQAFEEASQTILIEAGEKMWAAMMLQFSKREGRHVSARFVRSRTG